MCTVTCIPAAGGVFITSNRDERPGRLTGATPQQHVHNGVAACYVSDETAGGTWCGINQTGSIAVLLNGGRETHCPAPPYRHSRGLVVKQLLHEQNIIQAAHRYNANELEPFTIVLYNGVQLFEMIWNGHKKELHQLPAWKNHLWASATLYNETDRRQKRQQLNNWLCRQNVISGQGIAALHQAMRYENTVAPDLQAPGIETVSISVLEHRGHTVHMNYHHLRAGVPQSAISLPIQQATVYENQH